MNRKNKLIIVLLTLTIISLPALVVFAPPTGGLRIDPPLPYMSDTIAEFEVWAQSADSYDVNILLIITEECYNGMPSAPTVAVSVDYDSSLAQFTKADFASASSGFVPPSGTTPGARYTVASLKDHIDTSGDIYWAMKPLSSIIFNPLTSEHEDIYVYLDSSSPRMLIYLIGKSEGAELFDMVVPPTIPGFVVPEIPFGPIASLLTMLGSTVLLKLRKK